MSLKFDARIIGVHADEPNCNRWVELVSDEFQFPARFCISKSRATTMGRLIGETFTFETKGGYVDRFYYVHAIVEPK